MTVVSICKKFDFDAAHQLPKVPDGHKCKRLHGHTWYVEVVVRGEPDERGFVVDYAELAEAWTCINDLLDHRYLNDVPGLENPTTEVIAPFIFNKLLEKLPELLQSVRVYESKDTWCEVTRNDAVWAKYA